MSTGKTPIHTLFLQSTTFPISLITLRPTLYFQFRKTNSSTHQQSFFHVSVQHTVNIRPLSSDTMRHCQPELDDDELSLVERRRCCRRVCPSLHKTHRDKHHQMPSPTSRQTIVTNCSVQSLNFTQFTVWNSYITLQTLTKDLWYSNTPYQERHTRIGIDNKSEQPRSCLQSNSRIILQSIN